MEEAISYFYPGVPLRFSWFLIQACAGSVAGGTSPIAVTGLSDVLHYDVRHTRYVVAHYEQASAYLRLVVI